MYEILIVLGIFIATSTHASAQCTLEKSNELMMNAMDASMGAMVHPEKHPLGAAEAGRRVMEEASADLKAGNVDNACEKFTTCLDEFAALPAASDQGRCATLEWTGLLMETSRLSQNAIT